MSTPAGDDLIGNANIRITADTDPAIRALGRLSRDADGRIRDIRGRFVSESTLMRLGLVNAAGGGWVRAWACAAAVPETANLTPEPGPPLANAALIPVGDGRLCFQSLTDVDLVVDLNGWLTRSSTVGMVRSTAGRLLDTRSTASPIASSTAVGSPLARGTTTSAPSGM